MHWRFYLQQKVKGCRIVDEGLTSQEMKVKMRSAVVVDGLQCRICYYILGVLLFGGSHLLNGSVKLEGKLGNKYLLISGS